MIIETHIHICDEKYDADREEMLKRAEAAGVKKFINIGAEIEETRRVAVYDRPGVFKAIGLHPHYAEQGTPEVMKELAGFIGGAKNRVAVGEMGLDYFKSTTPKETQEKVFRQLMEMAKKNNMPAIIHSRDAHEDTLVMLKEFELDRKGVIHCFTGDYETAKKFIDIGYLLGIGGVLTFQNAGTLKETVKKIPFDKIVIETDAPWLAPQAVRGQRNESVFLEYIVKAIAELKGTSKEEVERITGENAEKLFTI